MVPSINKVRHRNMNLPLVKLEQSEPPNHKTKESVQKVGKVRQEVQEDTKKEQLWLKSSKLSAKTQFSKVSGMP